MGRRRNPHRNPIPGYIRLRLHRERKKMRQEQQINGFDISNNESPNSSNIDQKDTRQPLREKLKEWASTFSISTRALDSLLNILRSSDVIIDSSLLPKNHRTILKTPLNVPTTEIAGGELWYNGLEKSLKNIFSTLNHDIVVSLNFNIDGIPIYKSSKISFWPILANIYGSYTYIFMSKSLIN